MIKRLEEIIVLLVACMFTLPAGFHVLAAVTDNTAAANMETAAMKETDDEVPAETNERAANDNIIYDVTGPGSLTTDWEFDPRAGGTYWLTVHAFCGEPPHAGGTVYLSHFSVENEYGDDVKADGGEDWIRFKELAGHVMVVRAEFKTSYPIEIFDYETGGTVETFVNGESGREACAGDEITVNIETFRGYELEGFDIHDADGLQIPYEMRDQGTWTFIMPENIACIEGGFTKILYHITIEHDEQSRLTVYKDHRETEDACFRDLVEVRVSIREGYETDRFELLNETTGETIPVDPEAGLFMMPDSDVTLTHTTKLEEGAVLYTDECGNEYVAQGVMDFSKTDQRILRSGWYVLTKDETLHKRLRINGKVNLILSDGCTLWAGNGVQNGKGNTLVIWGQKGGTGVLKARSDLMGDDEIINNAASIGGDDQEDGGTFIIHSGKVMVEESGEDASGIGGGRNGDGGTIMIYGGVVKVNYKEHISGGGAAIGGGQYGTGGKIMIFGGEVEAYGNGDQTGAGAGIGGGEDRCGGSIEIFGGKIKAYGGDGHFSGAGAGIGGGDEGTGGTIRIYGGKIEAHGGISGDNPLEIGNGVGAGIGGGDKAEGGDIRFYGGDTKAFSPFRSGWFVNEQGAGIGGGNDADGGYIEVWGGRVEGHGYEAFGKGRGASSWGKLILGDNIWAGERDNLFPYWMRGIAARKPEVYLIAID